MRIYFEKDENRPILKVIAMDDASKHVYLIKLEGEDFSGHTLDGGTRHEDQMWQILVYTLKLLYEENDRQSKQLG